MKLLVVFKKYPVRKIKQLFTKLFAEKISYMLNKRDMLYKIDMLNRYINIYMFKKNQQHFPLHL